MCVCVRACLCMFVYIRSYLRVCIVFVHVYAETIRKHPLINNYLFMARQRDIDFLTKRRIGTHLALISTHHLLCLKRNAGSCKEAERMSRARRQLERKLNETWQTFPQSLTNANEGKSGEVSEDAKTRRLIC